MFNGKRYTVKQKLLAFGNKYNVYEDGEHILKSKKKKFKLKEDFRFTDADGESVLRVTTDQILDVSATYTIVDERTEEVVGSLKRDWKSFFKHHWKLLDPDGSVIATVQEDSLLYALLRRKVTTLIPFKYDIVGAAGGKPGDGEGPRPSGNRAKLGDIDGKFSLRDTYSVNLAAAAEGVLDPRLAVASAVVIDAIESN